MKLQDKYKRLYNQLSNPGEETSTSEVIWNDCIMEAIKDLFKEVHPDVEKLIRLNHI